MKSTIGSKAFTADMEREKKMSNKETIDKVLTDAMTVSRKQGQDLIKASLTALKTQFNERLVAFVSGTMHQVQVLEDQRDRLEECIKYQKDRLQAINDGEITIDQHGNIKFNAKELNNGLEHQ